MKKNISVFIFLLFIISACNNNSGGGNVTDPFGSGTGGSTGNTTGITFTISVQQGQQGVIFLVTPSVSVKIKKVTVSLPAQNFTDEVAGDETTVYNANMAVQIEEYTGVTSGQQWTFHFEGTRVDNNKAYNVKTNYTIP